MITVSGVSDLAGRFALIVGVPTTRFILKLWDSAGDNRAASSRVLDAGISLLPIVNPCIVLFFVAF